MKLFHLSDLHIGKMLNGYSLRESQKNAFLQILKYAEEEKPDAILICGDIYDKSVPAGEAYTLFDWFLTELSGRCPGTEIRSLREITIHRSGWRMAHRFSHATGPYRGAAAGRSDGVFKAGHTYR